LNFDALLICITAGYVATNKSHNRVAFLKMLGGVGPYIFMYVGDQRAQMHMMGVGLDAI